MSSTIWDSGQEHRRLGEDLNKFLYKDGKPKKNIKEEHTYEELWNMLESIRIDAWDAYDNVAYSMGWKDNVWSL